MELDDKTIAYLAGGVVLAATTFIQHMAFRSPYWKLRELTRRAIGIGSVLGLFGIFGVLWAGGDWKTYLAIAGYFVIAGAVKAGYEWVDATRRKTLVGALHDNTGAAE